MCCLLIAVLSEEGALWVATERCHANVADAAQYVQEMTCDCDTVWIRKTQGYCGHTQLDMAHAYWQPAGLQACAGDLGDAFAPTCCVRGYWVMWPGWLAVEGSPVSRTHCSTKYCYLQLLLVNFVVRTSG